MLNDLFLRRGRLPRAGPRRTRCSSSEAFAQAHGLEPGDRGRRRHQRPPARAARSSGVALSPEYVYTIRPGELLPGRPRASASSGWSGAALAAAFDMEGGFNDVALTLMPGAHRSRTSSRALDRLLAPLRRARRDPASAADLALVSSPTSWRSCAASAWSLPIVFLARRRVPAERRADAHRVGAARADRGAQGARLRQPRDRLALRQAGAWSIGAAGAVHRRRPSAPGSARR